MGKETGISWTDHTFNPWWGCTEVSPGCDRCYARVLDARWYPKIVTELVDGVLTDTKVAEHWGKGAPRREFGDKHWNEPLRWNADAAREGRKHLVFCASMADVMDDEAPAGARERLWALIDSTPNLIWQLLTKRPHRYGSVLPQYFRHGNVWLGTTAEDQRYYDVRWPILALAARAWKCPAWISYEPALGPLTISKWFPRFPDWMIFGGESGAGRRDCEAKWARDLRDECENIEVAFFMKQMSAATAPEGKALIPADLMIQQYPESYNGGAHGSL